jgi:ribulose-5-phosphate 4-epimerase/fuculose-1-phosphate aldolase
MTENDLRARITHWGASLHRRGFTSGSSGNISARCGDGFLATPTNSCLGELDPGDLSKLDREWRHVSGDKPTKEIPLHRAYYDARPDAGAVVHLHSTFATALSCLADVNPEDMIPPITPYVVMRVGRVPLIPYTLPGSAETGALVAAVAPTHAAVLLANHGPVVSASTLDAAVYAAEELEETAKLLLLTRGLPARFLAAEQVRALQAK